MASPTPQSLSTALARLTGAKGKNARETRKFRVEVISTDGKRCTVLIRISPKRVYPTTLKQLALELRVEREELEDVLENWTRERLIAHLSSFPAAVLDSLPQEARFRQHRKS